MNDIPPIVNNQNENVKKELKGTDKKDEISKNETTDLNKTITNEDKIIELQSIMNDTKKEMKANFDSVKWRTTILTLLLICNITIGIIIPNIK